MLRKLPKKSKKYFVVVCFNLLLCGVIAYSVESFLAFQVWDREFGVGRAHDNVGAANRQLYANHPYSITKFPTPTELKAHFNQKIYPRLSPSPLVTTEGMNIGGEKIFPFTGLNDSLTYFCQESGFWSIYKSDRFGFRNPDENWDKKDLDIVFLGDSFTHGACVDERDTFSGIANSRGLNTINLGIGGTGPLIHLAAFREYIVQSGLRPKKVVWVYYAEDTRDGVYEANSDVLTNYLNDPNFTQNLKKRNKEKHRIVEQFYAEEYPKMLVKLKKAREQRKRVVTMKIIVSALKLEFTRKMVSGLFEDSKVQETNTTKQLEIFNRTLKALKSSTKNLNAELIFVYLPTWVQYQSLDSYGIDSTTPNYLLRQDIFDTLEKNTVPIIDVHNYIKNHPSRSPSEFYNNGLYGHFTPTSYNEIGHFIQDSKALANIAR